MGVNRACRELMWFFGVLYVRLSLRLVPQGGFLLYQKSVFPIPICVSGFAAFQRLCFVSYFPVGVQAARRFRERYVAFLFLGFEEVGRVVVGYRVGQLCLRRFHGMVNRSARSSEEVRGFRVSNSFHGRSGNYREDPSRDG